MLKIIENVENQETILKAAPNTWSCKFKSAICIRNVVVLFWPSSVYKSNNSAMVFSCTEIRPPPFLPSFFYSLIFHGVSQVCFLYLIRIH